MSVYGYVRVSTRKQKLDRQTTNILSAYHTAIIKSEFYTGTTVIRPEWDKLKKKLHSGDTVVFDSVSRMSRNADEGFIDYQELFDAGVRLVFLKEPHINTEVYKQSIAKTFGIEVSTGNEAVDEYFAGNMELINRLLMKLAQQQIKLAFEQAEKEVADLHQRISEGIRESKLKGTQVGLAKGTSLTTRKSLDCKNIIKMHSKTFGGSLSDEETIKLCGCSRNTYYKYKREMYKG
ncbi:MAG: recombinase family protein [Clostridiales bacterium]|nr:recombinase family protein [Clostridiales bacterium]